MLRPDVNRPLAWAWGSFAAVLLVCGVGLSWFSDDGGLVRRIANKDRDYRKQVGDSEVILAREVDQQRRENRQLAETIATIKDQVGIERIDPFIVPEKGDRITHLKRIFSAIRDHLHERAKKRRVLYFDPEMGYDFENTRKINEAGIDAELTRLQLIAKAVLLALSTEDELTWITVEHGPIEQTGPTERPPLLIEYSFSLRVKGALKDVLWLIHQLGVEQPDEDIVRGYNALLTVVNKASRQEVHLLEKDDFFPLIVRGLTITSSNITARDSISMLDVTIDIAGMEFLSDEERAKGGRQREEDDRASSRPRTRTRTR